MKLLEKERIKLTNEHECAARLMETVPLIMRTLRQEIRGRRPGEFSVPQFRVLAFLRRNEGATLSDVTDHIGLSRPTLSKMVDGLVRRGWVARTASRRDRRCVRLRLTYRGMSVINAAREATCRKMAGWLKTLAPEDRSIIGRALNILQSIFAATPAADKTRKVE